MAGAYHSIFQAIGSYADSKAFTAGSLNSNVTSVTTPVVGMIPTASATVWVESGSPSGTFFIDVTNDLRAGDPNFTASAQWVTVQSVVYTAGVNPAGAAATQITWLNGSRFCRLRWVQSGGSGTGGAMITGTSS